LRHRRASRRTHERFVLSVACASADSVAPLLTAFLSCRRADSEAHSVSATRARAHVPHTGVARGAVARCRAARSSTCFSASCRPPAPAHPVFDSAFQCVLLHCHVLQTTTAARAPECVWHADGVPDATRPVRSDVGQLQSSSDWLATLVARPTALRSARRQLRVPLSNLFCRTREGPGQGVRAAPFCPGRRGRVGCYR